MNDPMDAAATAPSFLPVETGDEEHSLVGGNDDSSLSSVTSKPLDERILTFIKNAPDRTVRPAGVAAHLGISVNDACAELCGLLAAVGGGSKGATFHFVNLDGQHVMVFQFPPDFEARALRRRRYNDFYDTCRRALYVAIRALKIITAFGLVLSLLILCIAAVIGLAAALVAMSRGGGNDRNHQTILMRRLQGMFYTIRQLLWFYAVFGPTSEGQDPGLREIAYDLSLILSCCCGNPGSIFYWLRAQQLARRRNYALRRWGRSVVGSDVEGVYLVRRGSWGRDDENSGQSASLPDPNSKGLLSVAVEFLFGPEPALRNDPSGKWILRAAAIVNFSSKNNEGGIPLKVLAPYLDNPPASFGNGKEVIIEQALQVVAHFNGVPKESRLVEDSMEVIFAFPELMAESTVSTRYNRPIMQDCDTWEGFLCAQDGNDQWLRPSTELPEFLEEELYKFTRLTQTQLLHCTALGLLNLMGVVSFGQAISPSGLLELDEDSFLEAMIAGVLFPILRFYAIIFLLIPIARMIVLLFINSRRTLRNQRRQAIAQFLKTA